MDELLQQALERRKQLRAELEALDTFILSYSTAAERRSNPPKQADLFIQTKQTNFKARRAAENAAAMETAEKLILAAGRPLSRTELLESLERHGHKIEGSDKSKVLGTNIWRSKRFHNLKGVGYWPISEPIPEKYAKLPKRESMLLNPS